MHAPRATALWIWITLFSLCIYNRATIRAKHRLDRVAQCVLFLICAQMCIFTRCGRWHLFFAGPLSRVFVVFVAAGALQWSQITGFAGRRYNNIGIQTPRVPSNYWLANPTLTHTHTYARSVYAMSDWNNCARECTAYELYMWCVRGVHSKRFAGSKALLTDKLLRICQTKFGKVNGMCDVIAGVIELCWEFRYEECQFGSASPSPSELISYTWMFISNICV